MNKKNVYINPLGSVLITLLLLGASIDLYQRFSVLNLYLVVFCSLMFSYIFFHTIFPFWSFDEVGFEKNLFGFRKRKYSRKEIREINRPSSDVVWIFPKNNVRTILGKLLVRDYEENLMEIFRLVQLNSPNAKIDPWLLEHCKKKIG